MFDLSGKTALLTGASGGIGNAITRQLLRAGVKTAISGTRIEALNALAEELGENCIPTPCDLTDHAAQDRLLDDAKTALGAVPDILISNAGLTRDSLLMRMKDQDWNQVLEVNLSAHFRLCRAAMRPMLKRSYGRIIGISSVVGVTGNPGQCNYVAAKAGMIGFCKALAQETASRHITVNCIAPGFIESPMTDKLPQNRREQILAAIPARRLGSGEDIAAAILYLASDEASYVTGQTLHINGGLAML